MKGDWLEKPCLGGELHTNRVVKPLSMASASFRLLALCDEGIEGAQAMGDEDRLSFFKETKRKLADA